MSSIIEESRTSETTKIATRTSVGACMNKKWREVMSTDEKRFNLETINYLETNLHYYRGKKEATTSVCRRLTEGGGYSDLGRYRLPR